MGGNNLVAAIFVSPLLLRLFSGQCSPIGQALRWTVFCPPERSEGSVLRTRGFVQSYNKCGLQPRIHRYAQEDKGRMDDQARVGDGGAEIPSDQGLALRIFWRIMQVWAPGRLVLRNAVPEAVALYPGTAFRDTAFRDTWPEKVCTKKRSYAFSLRNSFIIKSGKRDSNSRPPAWEASALPTELFPQGRFPANLLGF